MAGQNFTSYTDFHKATGNVYLTGPDMCLNEAVKNEEYFHARFLRGKEYSKVLQGGPTIKTQRMFDEQTTLENYRPGQVINYSNPQVIVDSTDYWRRQRDHMAWIDDELILQANGSSAERFQVYLNMRKKLEMRLWTSYCNGQERDLWAVPVQDMEDVDGLTPRSIPFWVNEETNGLPTGVTLKGGINPATEPRWRPLKETYANDLPNGAGANALHWSAFTAFENVIHKTKFASLPTKGMYSDAPYMTDVIATQLKGLTNFTQALRVNQDSFYLKQDPNYPNPVFAGIPIVRVPELETAAIFPNGSGGYVTYTAADLAGPRYFCLQAKYLDLVYHSQRYMKLLEVTTDHNQPDTHAQNVVTYKQLTALSLQRQAIVSPSADIS